MGWIIDYPKELDENCPVCGKPVEEQKTTSPPINYCANRHQWKVDVVSGPPWQVKVRMFDGSDMAFVVADK